MPSRTARVLIDGDLYDCGPPGPGGRRVCAPAERTAVVTRGPRSVSARLTPPDARALAGALAMGAAGTRPGVLARRAGALELPRRARGAAGVVTEAFLGDVADRVRGALEVYGYEVARAERF